MGLGEGYKLAAEARKAEWQELIARFQRANLPVPETCLLNPQITGT